ncbi:SGNH hydrolase [Penicillium subrubescens]|uniref:SGNH hydrolase n=1 Tax=Penicillium subrubescens TaxID=1316194 RepID=UPI0025455C44|nr:SGNH hydrolase [Penicillium subrubescens]KAJ5886099.1 SGNH hydrolase [Penicillium subrubescens]
MTQSLSILCFGDSLTAGFYHHGLGYHPYAKKLYECLQAAFPTAEFMIEVDGAPGDLVTSPPGSFLSRIQGKCVTKKYDWVIVLGGTNDLGFGNDPDKIYAALQGCWNVVLATGGKVLALTVPECAADSAILDQRRTELNSYILGHQAEQFYTFDLKSKIPYRSATHAFRDGIFDDGLHLTPAGYDLMGNIVGAHLINL